VYFFARQQAVHAERDIVMAFLSVSPYVCPLLVLCLNEWTYHHTFWLVWE